MKILGNNGGVFATNSFLVADEVAKQAVIFDAPDHTTAPLLETAEKNGWDIIGLWLTHGHIDHIADHAFVTEKFPNAKVLIHSADRYKLAKPTAGMPLPFETPGRSPDGLLEDGQRLKIGSCDVEVIHTPGHSPGHVMFYLPSADILVGGDLIIMGAVGRTDFPDCSNADLQKSIRRIMRLPRQTRLLPGHGKPSTLADEAKNNPFVQEALGL
jgi:hydroxyacylglutathione hydrolase